MASGVTVAYNGNVIHQMAGNGNFKMNTEGVYMEGDVDVVVDVAGGGGTFMSKTITENGVYDASDDNVDGYSQVTVSVPTGGGDGGLSIMICGETGSIANSVFSTIRDCAFYYCSALTAADFPNVQNIGRSAFYSCTSLSEISFPSCVSISSNAFYYCGSLKSASFPSCVSMSDNAFAYCTKLEIANFPLLESVPYRAFMSCTSLFDVNLPSCVYVGQQAFTYCTLLGTISLPNASTFYASAFSNCTHLSQLFILGSKVVGLGNGAVFNNTPFTSPTYLGYYGSIYVPASLYDTYISKTYWSTIAARIVSMTDEEIAAL